jgi:hypothetical protein
MTNPNSAASRRPALTSVQRDQFLETGMAHIPALIPKRITDAMADALWETLARQHRIDRRRPETWTVARPTKLQELKRSGAFDVMNCPELRSVLDEVFTDRGWVAPKHWGQALVTFREDDAPWTVPSVAWHVDMIDQAALSPWPHYVRLFVLLAPVEPGGGGTVYLAGSHRLVMRLMAQASGPGENRCNPLRERLKRLDPWIAELCTGQGAGRIERFMQAGAEIGGAPLRVAETVGGAGDLFIMHPAMLHAAAPCASPEPRLVAAETIVARQSG